MSDSKQNEVAIIGGGIAGMATALCLHSLNIPCTVYEMRASELGPRTAGGGMMVGANSLRILDSWGVCEKMVPLGYSFDVVHYKNADEETVDRFPFGNKAVFGYDGLRIYRQQYLECLYQTCREKGISILFNTRFTRVVAETETNITFELSDGTTRTARLLIGADGIHSRVRAYIDPTSTTRFVGAMAITYEARTADLRLPPPTARTAYTFPVQVTTSAGAFVLAPQTPDGSLMLAGAQFPTHDRSRAEWAALAADKAFLAGLLRRDAAAAMPEAVRSALERVGADTDSLHVWPFYQLPRLAAWRSHGAGRHARAVVLGDAAHAVPPTTGQGAGMGVEDALALGRLVAAEAAGRVGWGAALEFWQDARQRRIDAVLELTRLLNNKRLPSGQQAELKPEDLWTSEAETNPRQMAWLYEPGIEEEVEAWVKGQEGA